jgi:hypothetical protein
MPAFARVEQQGTAERIAFTGLRLEIAQDCARKRIAEPGGMGEDVPNGRRAGCRAQAVGAGRGIERFKYFGICKLGQKLFDRIVETEATLLDELHCRHRCDRFGHRGDAEQRVGRERASG